MRVTKGFCYVLMVFILVLQTGTLLAQFPFYKGNNIPKQHAIHDLRFIQTILKKNHPSYDWYTPAYITDNAFDNAVASIGDSISEIDFVLMASKCINLIKCGHTSIYLPKKSLDTISKSYKTVLNVAFVPQQDTLLVTYASLGWNQQIIRGSRVFAINGISSKKIIDSLKQYFSGDGNADIYRERKLGNNFPYIFRNVFGIASQYDFDYIDQQGVMQKSTAQLSNGYYRILPRITDTLSAKNNINPLREIIDNKRDSIKKTFKDSIQKQRTKIDTTVKVPITNVKPAKPVKPVKLTKRQQKKRRKEEVKERYRKITYDTTYNMAYFELNAFKGYGFRRYLKRNFKKMKHNGIQNLVVDVRDNGGGFISKYIGFTKYISDHRFKVADTVSAISKKLYQKKHMKLGIWNQLFLTLFTRKKSDGRYHYRPYEKIRHRIKKRFHFNGNVYAISGAYSFSATTLFLNNIKGQKNVTIVGDETGGAHYGNNGVLLPDITLPKTKMVLHMPLLRVVINKNMPFNGHGVIPDVLATPNFKTLYMGTDVKREKVLELIKQNRR
jgi:C-terminal processing protease CtpA/Prc